MSDGSIDDQSPPPASDPPHDASGSETKPDRVFLVSYPKIMFLYPTVLTALFCAIVMWAKGNDTASEYAWICGRVFLTVMTVNLVVISFDFPRTTSLTWFFAVVALSIGGWAILVLNPGLAPRVVDLLLKIKPSANGAFYIIFCVGMMLLYICVMVSRRFDYWEVRGNELLHHHGVLSDLERFSAPNLRIDKEINDVFEYLLLRAGRLVLHPSNERRAIVLENVFFINDKEERITKMLGALQVRIKTDH
jgi:hypothetical protein